jgi:hypothetical protein
MLLMLELPPRASVSADPLIMKSTLLPILFDTLALNTRFFFEIASTRFGVEHLVISNLTRIAAENSQGYVT